MGNGGVMEKREREERVYKERREWDEDDGECGGLLVNGA